MRKLASIIVLMIIVSVRANSNEFNSNSNGLIYSDSTITKLKHIVDSLNLKFKYCDLKKIYFSKYQAKVNLIKVEGNKAEEIKKDLENQITFNDFLKKYPKLKVEKDVLVVMHKYKNYNEKEKIEFEFIKSESDYNDQIEINADDFEIKKSIRGKWIFEYYEKDTFSKASLKAIYFVDELAKQIIPEKYSRLIQYSDCLIDTNQTVFYKEVERTSFRYKQNESKALTKFLEYVHTKTQKPEKFDYSKSDKEYKIWAEKYKYWHSIRFYRCDSLIKIDPNFSILLDLAIKDAVDGATNDEFEEYVARYNSKELVLEMKRNRIVSGTCSRDQSPRIHAFNIASLAAETVKWEIFLRSHLNIMNDRFARASDGSYAWQARQTYIRELEVLDINVTDLLFGICLNIENPSQNHYFGSIDRIGRALAESDKKVEIENQMLELISDNKLDDYNRIIFVYLFLNYNYNLENKTQQKENKVKLQQVINKLPKHLASQIKIK